MAQNTYVNGNRYSFVNIQIELSQFSVGNIQTPSGIYVPARGVLKSINYDAQQEPGIVQGNQVGITGRTSGYGTATGSTEVLVSDFDDMAYALTGGGAYALFDVDFNISVSYSINGIDVRTDQLVGTRFTKGGSANQQGNDATTVSLDLNIAYLIKNNIAMFRQT